MSQGSLDPKIWFLGQKVCSVARIQTDTQTDWHTDRHESEYRDTLSGFQGFFLQPIIKDRSNILVHIFFLNMYLSNIHTSPVNLFHISHSQIPPVLVVQCVVPRLQTGGRRHEAQLDGQVWCCRGRHPGLQGALLTAGRWQHVQCPLRLRVWVSHYNHFISIFLFGFCGVMHSVPDSTTRLTLICVFKYWSWHHWPYPIQVWCVCDYRQRTIPVRINRPCALTLLVCFEGSFDSSMEWSRSVRSRPGLKKGYIIALIIYVIVFYQKINTCDQFAWYWGCSCFFQDHFQYFL